MTADKADCSGLVCRIFAMMYTCSKTTRETADEIKTVLLIRLSLKDQTQIR